MNLSRYRSIRRSFAERLAVLALVIAALFLAACSGSSDSPTADPSGVRYPPAVVAEFFRSCVAAAEAAAGAEGAGTDIQALCDCTIEEIQKTVTFDDFRTYQNSLFGDDPPPPGVGSRLRAAAEGCQ